MRVRLVIVLCLAAVVIALALPAVAAAKTTAKTSFSSTLSATNKANVWGSAKLKLQMRPLGLRVTLRVRGLQSGKPHAAAIYGFVDGRQAKCPGPSADTNGDGLISGPEVRAVAGEPLVWLTPFKKGKRHGTWVYQGRISGAALAALNPVGVRLSERIIVVSGVTQMPTYTLPFWDPDAPAACGAIKADEL